MASTCFVSSDPFVLSNDNVLMDVQTATRILNPAALPEQIPLSTSPSLDIPISSLSLTEEKHLETSFIPRNDDEKQELNASKKHLRETIASIEKNWKAAEEEKYRIKQELEDLMEKHSMLEVDFLKEKEDKLISHQDRYKALQERHKHELEDMKKAGHDALSIIVEEFKALLQSTVEQREEVIEKQHITVIEKQAQKCEQLLIAQFLIPSSSCPSLHLFFRLNTRCYSAESPRNHGADFPSEGG
uniref:Coiled-coil domain-containing protein 91 n=1 Tax=Sphenodon punctatus TaxID=8508 RepID=A0A8D0H1J2_SPHPU